MENSVSSILVPLHMIVLFRGVCVDKDRHDWIQLTFPVSEISAVAVTRCHLFEFLFAGRSYTVVCYKAAGDSICKTHCTVYSTNL